MSNTTKILRSRQEVMYQIERLLNYHTSMIGLVSQGRTTNATEKTLEAYGDFYDWLNGEE